MTFFVKIAITAALGASLSACGGQSVEQATLSRAEAYDAMSNRVSSMTRTGPVKVDQATGSATFSGYAGIVAGSEYDATILVGDADVAVNFDGNGAVNGTITNVSGGAGINTYISGTGRIDSYDGQIDISNGSVGTGNALRADYRGTLRGNGDTIVTSGTMTGEFLGNPTIRALELEGVNRGTLNGSTTVVGVFVTAQRD